MTTYLIASNEMMCRILARRMEGLELPTPVQWHAPEWLLDAAATDICADFPADIVLVDSSGVSGDPRVLLDRVHARLAPRRWLVLSDALDSSLMLHAARLGASGCLAVPAPVELVCAAAALVWAGGQCFPRAALTLLRAGYPHSASPAVPLPSVRPGGAGGNTTATG